MRGSLQLFHVSKYASVPLCAVAVWALVVKGDYKSVEKIFLIASVFYICYIVAGVLAQPDWHTALVETVKIPGRNVWRDHNYVYMVIGVIGTTITPWMQFYLQSSIVEKGVSIKQYAGFAAGCDCGVVLHGYCGVVHHRGVRGDAVDAWDAEHQCAVGCGAGDAAIGGGLCVYFVCGWVVQLRRSLRRVCCRFLPRTACARGWGLRVGWIRSSRRHRSFTGSIPC